jgi:acetyl esterase/lipase
VFEPLVGQQFLYGNDPSQTAQLWVPLTSGELPVVVLVHGGFWRRSYGADLMEPLAVDLFERGFAVWNIEYGRVGEAKGGWPFTLEHVAAAVDYLAVLAEGLPLDLDRVAVVGHSAGGHLAVWSGSRNLLAERSPGAMPKVEPKLVIGQGAVIDLVAAARDEIGNRAVIDFLGGTAAEVPERYDVAQPKQGGAQIVLVNGSLDDTVELEYSQYQGIEAALMVVPDVDHMQLIEPANPSWQAVIGALNGL